MNSKTYYYILLWPIDFWDGWVTVGEYLGILRNRKKKNSKIIVDPWLDEDLIKAKVSRICNGLKRHYWVCDPVKYDENIFISGIPDLNGGNDSEMIFAFKEENNGTTYIVSSRELPWLDEQSNEVKIDE